jgi:hypothetical protein
VFLLLLDVAPTIIEKIVWKGNFTNYIL